MKEPLLSIIIPFYNIEHWLLERCVESVCNQPIDATDYEIIVIDDGSANPPGNIIKSFSKENISLHRQENQGLGGARNTGLELARGKYVFFIDSDDYLYDHTLAYCLSLLKEKNPDLVNFRFRMIYGKDKKQIRENNATCAPIISGARYMLSHNLSGCAWLYIFRKTLATENNITFTKGIYHEDEEFTTKIYFYAGKLIATNLIVYAYYQRDDSIVNKKDVSHLDKRFTDIREAIKRLNGFRQQVKSDSSEEQQEGLERKISFLTVDFIICMLREFCPLSYIDKNLEELRKQKLYPLSKKDYSLKYKFFRILANNKPGLCFLYVSEWFRLKLKKDENTADRRIQ